MPLGLKRYQQSRQTHFVTFSCFHRHSYLKDLCLGELFASCLERIRCKYQLRVYGYVIMPEHVHMLLSEPENVPLAVAIQSLKLRVVRSSLVSEKELSPFWQRRYYDHNVRGYESFVQKLRYIHRNPVKRGLCGTPDQWEWSSFRHYATAEKGIVEIESEWTGLRREGREPHLLTVPD